MELAPHVCDRLYVLAEGKIALEERANVVNLRERALIDANLG